MLDRRGQTYPSGEFVGVGDVEMDCALSSAVLRADAVAFRVVGSGGRTVCAATSRSECGSSTAVGERVLLPG